MISLTNVWRTYGSGEAEVHALADFSLSIDAGEFVSVTGPSGCGKSTLLNLVGALDQPTSGTVEVAGVSLHEATEADLTRYRRTRLGIVFQFFNLLPSMRIIENIELPLLLQGEEARSASGKARELAELVGIAKRLEHFPHQLSGGEMQRAAIARALVHDPEVLLADEPTGNLDSASAEMVTETLTKIASQRSVTLLLVTHSEEVAGLAGRRIRLHDGRLESDSVE